VLCSVGSVTFLIGVLRRGVADILSSAVKDFWTEGSKVKGKPARHAAWYAKYRAGIPGFTLLLKDLDRTDANTIVSLLAHHWSTHLPALQGEISLLSLF
jgi:hypothetical protein